MRTLYPIELVLRGIPEGFLVIFAIYIFSQTKINKKKYFITSLAFTSITYTTRMLPINYGVHMILSLLLLLIIIISYNKIDAVKGIKSIIFIYLIELISELINVLILNNFNVNLEVLLKDPIYKNILGFPSLIITTFIIFIIYKMNERRRKPKEL